MEISAKASAKIKILENLIKAHTEMTDSQQLEVRDYLLLTKFILKLIEKGFYNFNYIVSENSEDGDG